MPRKIHPANVVGPQIRKTRCQLELSQEELAARCQMAGLDISRSTLGQIEIRFRYISDEELFLLASVLDVTPNDLYPAEMRKQMRGKRPKPPHPKSK